jgi:hypothetical protein
MIRHNGHLWRNPTSFASTVQGGTMDDSSQTAASAKDFSERRNGCAQSCRSLLNIMCNQDHFYKSSDSMDEGVEKQTDWSDDEDNTSITTGT